MQCDKITASVVNLSLEMAGSVLTMDDNREGPQDRLHLRNTSFLKGIYERFFFLLVLRIEMKTLENHALWRVVHHCCFLIKYHVMKPDTHQSQI